MAKQNNKSDTTSSSKIKTGAVINRRANHTLDQSRATSAPKWKSVGPAGLLESIKHPGTFIARGAGLARGTNNWGSASRKMVEVIVAEEAARQAEASLTSQQAEVK